MPRTKFASEEEKLEYYRNRTRAWRAKRKALGLPTNYRSPQAKNATKRWYDERKSDPKFLIAQAEKVRRYRERLRAKGIKPHKPYTEEQKIAKRAYVKERRACLKSISSPIDELELKRRKEERVRAICKWKLENPEAAKVSRKRRQNVTLATPKGRINNSVRAVFRDAVKCNYGKSKYTEILGYTWRDLQVHLESRFTEGMTWALFIEGQIHIDHIKPLKLFNYQSIYDAQFKEAWSLNNLQPLWRIDNLRKSDNYISE